MNQLTHEELGSPADSMEAVISSNEESTGESCPSVDSSPQTKVDPQIEAVMYLQGAIPAFRNQLEKTTGTQAKSVLMALTEAPLAEKSPEFTTQEALLLYNIGLQITNCKFILFQEAIKGKTAEELLTLGSEELKEQTVEEKKE